jgi:hypothetical protein
MTLPLSEAERGNARITNIGTLGYPFTLRL